MQQDLKRSRTELTVDLDTGEVLAEELTPCEPYQDKLVEFTKVLFPHIVPERVPNGALHIENLWEKEGLVK